MARFNLIAKTAEERKSELYGLAPYLVYKVGDKTYNYGAKAVAGLFRSGALASVNPTEILSIGAGVTNLSLCFRGKSSIVKMHSANWDGVSLTSLYMAFAFLSGLKALDLSKWKITSITNMSYMCNSCTNLTLLGLPTIPSGCTTSSAFDGCTALTEAFFGDGCKIYPTISFGACPLSFASVCNVLGALADTPDSGATCTFKSGLYASFTSEQKAVIDALVADKESKGWDVLNMAE